MFEATAWRLSTARQKAAPSRLVYQWPRTTTLPQKIEESTTPSRRKAVFQRLLPRSSSSLRRRDSFLLKGLFGKRTTLSAAADTSPRPSSLRASTAALLLSLLWSFSGILVPHAHDTTSTTWNHQPARLAAVLPTTQAKRRPAKATTKTGPVKVVTASGILVGAVAGGSLLGRTMATKQQQQKDDDEVVEEIVDDVIRETVEDDLTLRRSTKKQQRRQSALLEKVQKAATNTTGQQEEGEDTTLEGGGKVVGEQQAREMVQRILNQYHEETSDKTAPMAPQSGVAVATPVNGGEDSAIGNNNSPFLPFSTKSPPIQQPEDGNDTNTSRSVSFFDAIQQMTPAKRASQSHLDPLPPGVLRRQPKSPQEEETLRARYAGIPDVGDRAYQILLDLGAFE
eukprot:scaffold6562_cov163-Amphora_coffeaeformis.AAC.11